MLKLTAKRKEWFTVSQDPSGETQLEIVHLKPGEVSDIEAKANQVVGKQKGEEFETEIGFNLAQRTKLFVTRSIVDWKGFIGLNGKSLACTDHNKLQVLKEFDWFGPAVEEFRQELVETVEDETEEDEKN